MHAHDDLACFTRRADFVSHTLVGHQINMRYTRSVKDGNPWHMHRYAGTKVQYMRQTFLQGEGRAEVVAPGSSFGVQQGCIHRVAMLPCPVTGWFAALVWEAMDFPAWSLAFSTRTFDAVPCSLSKFQPVSPQEARQLLDDFIAANC